MTTKRTAKQLSQNGIEREIAENFLQNLGLEPFRRQDLFKLLAPRYGQFNGNAERRAGEYIDEWRKAGKLVKAGQVHWRASLGAHFDGDTFVRKTKTGRVLQELHQSVTLTQTTRAPDKWAMVDLETGKLYIGTPHGLALMNPEQEQELRQTLDLSAGASKTPLAEVRELSEMAKATGQPTRCAPGFNHGAFDVGPEALEALRQR